MVRSSHVLVDVLSKITTKMVLALVKIINSKMVDLVIINRVINANK